MSYTRPKFAFSKACYSATIWPIAMLFLFWTLCMNLCHSTAFHKKRLHGSARNMKWNMEFYFKFVLDLLIWGQKSKRESWPACLCINAHGCSSNRAWAIPVRSLLFSKACYSATIWPIFMFFILWTLCMNLKQLHGSARNMKWNMKILFKIAFDL